MKRKRNELKLTKKVKRRYTSFKGDENCLLVLVMNGRNTWERARVLIVSIQKKMNFINEFHRKLLAKFNFPQNTDSSQKY